MADEHWTFEMQLVDDGDNVFSESLDGITGPWSTRRAEPSASNSENSEPIGEARSKRIEHVRRVAQAG